MAACCLSLRFSLYFSIEHGIDKPLQNFEQIRRINTTATFGYEYHPGLLLILIYVVYWLIRHEAIVRNSGQTSITKRNMKKYFFGKFLSTDFWQKL